MIGTCKIKGKTESLDPTPKIWSNSYHTVLLTIGLCRPDDVCSLIFGLFVPVVPIINYDNNIMVFQRTIKETT